MSHRLISFFRADSVSSVACGSPYFFKKAGSPETGLPVCILTENRKTLFFDLFFAIPVHRSGRKLFFILKSL